MTFGYQVTIRDDKVALIRLALDAGGGSAKMRIYNGARPATGGALTGQTLGAELLLAAPPCGVEASGTLTFGAIAGDTSADNSINPATWVRFVTSADVFVMDGSVGLSGADVNLNTVNIVAGVPVNVTDFASITDGNP